ncbi:MAG: GTP cyclohydrolase [Bacteroidota bacterium]
MNHNLIKPRTRITSLLVLTSLLTTLIVIQGCKENDPTKEDVPELITKATLTFSPNGGGTPVVVTATDPDGEGVQDIKVDGSINLTATTSYVLSIGLINGLAAPTEPEYNATVEVEKEGDEHMFFFAWTNNTFFEPEGNGNIDARADAVNYTGGTNSTDVNGRPLGLTTTWTSATIAGTASLSGTFRILLKHQPTLKSDTSDSNTGETDLDLTFALNIH